MKFKPKQKLTPERLKVRVSRIMHCPYEVTSPQFSLNTYNLIMQFNETCPGPKSETFSDADFY